MIVLKPNHVANSDDGLCSHQTYSVARPSRRKVDAPLRPPRKRFASKHKSVLITSTDRLGVSGRRVEKTGHSGYRYRFSFFSLKEYDLVVATE